jgi:O-antigen/teichoic acid export membrane protein
MSQFARWKGFFGPKLHRVVEFMAAQGITMAGNLLYGFLCVRLLSKPEYARFAVVFATLSSLLLLSDVGISNSIIPLVGEKIGDSKLIADYIASLRTLSYRLFAFLVPATIVIFPLMVSHQHWSASVVGSMTAIVLVATWFARISSTYGVVLIMRRDRSRWYRAQMVSSLGTLALLCICWAAHWLNEWVAILINVVGMIYVALSYYRRAQHQLGVSGRSTAEKRKAIVHLTLPNTPNVVFYAIQGQIPQILVILFGVTYALADLGALSRLAQIFVIFSQMNPLLIEPYFARLPRNRLKSSYLAAVAVIVFVCLVIIAMGRFVPGLFLWVLGPKYQGLDYEVLLLLVGGSIRYLSGTMWIIHSARRFVYWWNNLSVVIVTLLVQIVFLLQGNLGTVRESLMFNIVSGGAALFVNILCAFFGFIYGPRAIKGVAPEVSAEIEGEMHG